MNRILCFRQWMMFEYSYVSRSRWSLKALSVICPCKDNHEWTYLSGDIQMISFVYSTEIKCLLARYGHLSDLEWLVFYKTGFFYEEHSLFWINTMDNYNAVYLLFFDLCLRKELNVNMPSLILSMRDNQIIIVFKYWAQK